MTLPRPEYIWMIRHEYNLKNSILSYSVTAISLIETLRCHRTHSFLIWIKLRYFFDYRFWKLCWVCRKSFNIWTITSGFRNIFFKATNRGWPIKTWPGVKHWRSPRSTLFILDYSSILKAVHFCRFFLFKIKFKFKTL